MTQLTISLDKSSEAAVEVCKTFFGTKSVAAATRSALLLALHVMRTMKDDTVQVLDQNTGKWMTIRIAR